MTSIKKLSFVFILAVALCVPSGAVVFAQSVGGASVQTNSATNISSYQATLNGFLTVPYISNSNYVYFQWGTTNSYGNQTIQQYLNNAGAFSQNISGLNYNTTYHFRAVAQGSFGTIYGQDLTFYTGQSNNSLITANAGPDLYLTSGQVVNLQGTGYDPNGYSLSYYWTCSGGSLSNYNIAQPVYTAPYAINGSNQTTYTCTLTVTNNYGSSNSDSVIIYVNYNGNGNLGQNYVQTNYATNILDIGATFNGYLYGSSYPTSYVYFQWGTTVSYGNETPKITIGYSGPFVQSMGSLTPGTTYHYRAVSQSGYYGVTIYGPDVTFTTYGGVTYTPQTIYNYNGGGRVLGASTVSTGITDNFFTNSFFLPLLLIVLGLWFYFSGRATRFADKLKFKTKK